jgi:hypothetical protein
MQTRNILPTRADERRVDMPGHIDIALAGTWPGRKCGIPLASAILFPDHNIRCAENCVRPVRGLEENGPGKTV